MRERVAANDRHTEHAASTVRARVVNLQRALEHTRLLRTVLVAAAASLTISVTLRVLIVLLSAIMPTLSTSPVAGALSTPGARATVALAVFVTVMTRAMMRWQPITPVRAALWYEERHPAAHAVVTLVENDQLAGDVAERLAAQSRMSSGDALPAREAVRHTRWRAVRAPLALIVCAFAMLVLVSVIATPESSVAAARGVAANTLVRSLGTPDSRLESWRIEVVPPGYSRLPTRVLTDSATVSALVGSRIRISGRGETNGLQASVTAAGGRATTLDIVADEIAASRWSTTMVVSPEPGAITVRDGADSRLLVIVPRVDSLPQVRLVAPFRDSVYRDSTGIVSLVAELRDDLGLASAAFEVILTSGAGEQFTAQTVRLAERRFAGARSGRIEHALSFSALGVKSGDVLHVRAVGRDEHPLASREFGVSETRSLRFARAEEYDSVAVEAAPPPAVDSSLLSQRMLLELTLKLEARRPRMARENLVSESRRLATEQARIRRAVSAIVYARMSGEGESEHVHYEGDGHDHGLTMQEGKLVPTFGGAATATAGTPARVNNNVSEESPIVAVNLPLLEAYNAMWDAGRALEQADPRAAIPPMRLALAAIQRARAAERVYLRGRVRPIVVDLVRVRLAGKDTGQDARRLPGVSVADPVRLLDARFMRAALRLTVDAVAARDSIVALRLDALADAPMFSQALDGVLLALRDGRDATDAVVFARRTLTRPAVTRGVSAWSVP